jgi:hypothetical protein
MSGAASMVCLTGGAMFRRWVVGLSVGLCVVLGLIVLVPRAIYGEPKGNWLTWQPVSGCELPCWRGIVPGKTSEKEALSLLSRMPDVQLRVTDSSKWSGEVKTIRTSKSLLLLSLEFTSGTSIRLRFLGQGLGVGLDMTLSEIIQAIETPVGYEYHRDTNSIVISWTQNIRTRTGFYGEAIDSICKNTFDKLPIGLIYYLDINFSLDTYLPYLTKWRGYDEMRNALCHPMR